MSPCDSSSTGNQSSSMQLDLRSPSNIKLGGSEITDDNDDRMVLNSNMVVYVQDSRFDTSIDQHLFFITLWQWWIS